MDTSIQCLFVYGYCIGPSLRIVLEIYDNHVGLHYNNYHNGKLCRVIRIHFVSFVRMWNAVHEAFVCSFPLWRWFAENSKFVLMKNFNSVWLQFDIPTFKIDERTDQNFTPKFRQKSPAVTHFHCVIQKEKWTKTDTDQCLF